MAAAGENTSASRNKGPAARLSAALGRAASVSARYVQRTTGVVRPPAAGHVPSWLNKAGGDDMELSDRTESCRLTVPDETSPLLAFPAPNGLRPRRCSSLGSRDDAAEADAEVADEEKPQVSPRQLWLNRIKTGVLSVVVVFAVARSRPRGTRNPVQVPAKRRDNPYIIFDVATRVSCSSEKG
ncbi:hypothetical protein HPB50_005220 [Hyalomma asiaticum]|uniref:Uncharacterized protein n=1 Tax=Hyalomma asiaticum TaxID=266040 RepID=A0ACB7SKD9_HYAAI|nr:hypothetical protein HPB50_005220 [Hyalomma asiaticum]